MKIAYYLLGNSRVYISQINIPNVDNHLVLNFTEERSTIGVGIDIDQRKISFRNHVQTISFDFEPTKSGHLGWSFILEEGINKMQEYRSDNVSTVFKRK